MACSCTSRKPSTEVDYYLYCRKPWEMIPDGQKYPLQTEDPQKTGLVLNRADTSLPSQIIFLPLIRANQSAGPTISTREALQPFSLSLLLLCSLLSPKLSTDDLASYFLEKEKALTQELPQLPITKSSSQPPSLLSFCLPLCKEGLIALCLSSCGHCPCSRPCAVRLPLANRLDFWA